MSYDVYFITYSGMPVPILQDVSKEEAKAYANKRKRRYRRDGYYVQYIEKGTWEYNDENCILINDTQGYLKIRPVSEKRRKILYG